MRIAICDDEPALLEQLEKLIAVWGRLREEPCRTSAFSSGEALLFSTAGGYPYDLILLDIELTGIGGVALARVIRKHDKKVPLAFLTNHRGYVFEGYEVSALRYLLKPVSKTTLFPLLDLVQENLRLEPACLLLETGGESLRIEQDALLCLEAQGHRVLLQTTGGPLEAKASFSALSRQLGTSFVPTHRSYLVNLRYVERVTRRECFLEGGLSVPVSRSAWQDLNCAFIKYYREA